MLDGKEMRSERAKRKIQDLMLTFGELPSAPSMDGDSFGGSVPFVLVCIGYCPDLVLTPSVLILGIVRNLSRLLD